MKIEMQFEGCTVSGTINGKPFTVSQDGIATSMDGPFDPDGQRFANENGIAHIVIRETLGAIAHFACGGWNYWVRLKHGGGQSCAACARQMAEMRKRELGGMYEV